MSSLSASGTIRGSAVNTPGTSVKISHASAPSAAASATAVVSEPPRPNVVTSCVDVDTPWNPATSTILFSVECVVDARRAHLDDLRLRVAGVGDDARLRAGERDGLVRRGRGSPSRRARSRCARRSRRACRTRAGAARARPRVRGGSARPSCGPSPRGRRRPSRRPRAPRRAAPRPASACRCRRRRCRRTSSPRAPACGRGCWTLGTASKWSVVILRQCRDEAAASFVASRMGRARLRRRRTRAASMGVLAFVLAAGDAPLGALGHRVVRVRRRARGVLLCDRDRRVSPRGRLGGRLRCGDRDDAHRRRVVRRDAREPRERARDGDRLGRRVRAACGSRLLLDRVSDGAASSRRSLHLAPTGQGAAEGDLVGVLEVAADGEPAREPRDADASA